MLLLQVGLMYLAVTLSYDAGLNYAGYCIPENRILSEDEMIRIALSDINRPRKKFKLYSEQSGGEVKKRLQESYVPYSSVEDILEKNPHCCSFSLRSHVTSDGSRPPPTFVNRISGVHKGYIRYRINAQYLSNETGDHFQRDESGDYKISNCGRIYN